MYQTVFEIHIGMSPYQLVFGKACHIPIEVEHKALWAFHKFNMNSEDSSRSRVDKLQEIDGFCLKSLTVPLSAIAYKDMT